jgi:hypothetical protein
MTAPDSSSPTGAVTTGTVTTAAAARVLVRPQERRFLEPFVGRELAPAQAARELGVPVEQMAYRVRALRDKGLLAATRTAARAGRPVTYYRAAAQIEAPVVLLAEADTRAVFELLDAGGRAAFLDALAAGADLSGLRDWAVRLHRPTGRDVRLDVVPGRPDWSGEVLLDPAAPAVLFHWVPLRLSREQAKQLQHELAAVVQRWAAATPEPDADPDHLLGLFLTPLGRR